jgi:hypothetical protein
MAYLRWCARPVRGSEAMHDEQKMCEHGSCSGTRGPGGSVKRSSQISQVRRELMSLERTMVGEG